MKELSDEECDAIFHAERQLDRWVIGGLNDGRALIRAGYAAALAAQPAVVPREPTQAMLRAVADLMMAQCDDAPLTWSAIWRAMYDTAQRSTDGPGNHLDSGENSSANHKSDLRQVRREPEQSGCTGNVLTPGPSTPTQPAPPCVWRSGCESPAQCMAEQRCCQTPAQPAAPAPAPDIATIKAWAASPEGQAALAAAIVSAEEAAAELSRARTVTVEMMNTPIGVRTAAASDRISPHTDCLARADLRSLEERKV